MRQRPRADRTPAHRISIHAPLAGCDSNHAVIRGKPWISIHAPLAGCDSPTGAPKQPHMYFNPRTPCGVRLNKMFGLPPILKFQSTHPLRGATLCDRFRHRRGAISIHAPLAGCDARQIPLCLRPEDFNPRTPCGVRQRYAFASDAHDLFQSTHPLRGATPPCSFVTSNI